MSTFSDVKSSDSADMKGVVTAGGSETAQRIDFIHNEVDIALFTECRCHLQSIGGIASARRVMRIGEHECPHLLLIPLSSVSGLYKGWQQVPVAESLAA